MWGPAVVLIFALLQAPDYSADGLKALEDGKYAVAAEMFSKAVAADPKDYAAQFHLALANSLLGKDAEAIAGFKIVLELKPGLYEAELNLGMVLIRAKRAGEAVPLLEAAATEQPKEFRPNFFLAEALETTGDFAKAEQAYRAAAELDPKSADAELGLGRAKARQNRLDDAAANYHKAAELDPALKNALLELAGLYEKNDNAAQAIEIYGQFPDNVGAREQMGELLIEAGKPAEAASQLEWAVAKSPTAANRAALATAYQRSNQPEKAAEQLQQAVAMEPQSLELRMRYGRALRDLRKFQPAAAEFLRVTQAKPDSVDAWNELASMLILIENYPAALGALDRIKQLGAETPGHYYLRAIMLDKMKQFKPALESYQKFLAMSNGKFPDEEWKSRQRIRVLEKETGGR